MPIFADKSPAERNKLIVAIVLGVIAVFAVGYLLLGSSSTPPRTVKTTTNPNKGGPLDPNGRAQSTAMPVVQINQQKQTLAPTPIDPRFPEPGSAEVGRNIFGFYVPPPTPSPTLAPPPAPSPMPSPPISLASLSPQSVFARTAEFDLVVSGDKFVNGVQIYINDVQVPTHFVSQQQVTAKIPAGLIVGEGQRIVAVKSTDGKLWSNTATLVVQAPPTPNFNYIGIFETKRLVGTAILEDKNTKAQVSAQRGDVVGGRFRVSSISTREVVLVDTTLRIKHTIAFTGDSVKTGPVTGQQRRPDPDDEDAVP
jgi:hypothetical protein